MWWIVNSGPRESPHREVFSSPQVAVRAVTGYSDACCFVTFNHIEDIRSLDRPGFGQEFLRFKRIDALHILTRENDWFQNEDFLVACAQVAELTRHYRRVVAYGSSMGGYAAIRYGGRVGAGVAFAMSPQYSINPCEAGFEYRWNNLCSRIDFTNEVSGSCFVPSAFIAYDPYSLDIRHVDLLRRYTHVTDIRILNSGHPCTGYLSELGLLQQAVVDLAGGTFDPLALQRRARELRKNAGQFYSRLSRRARSDALSRTLLERAVERWPKDAGYLTQLAILTGLAGRMTAAFALIDRAFAVAPRSRFVRYGGSELFEMTGDLDHSIELMEDLCREFFEDRTYHRRLMHLRWRRRSWLYRRLTVPSDLWRIRRALHAFARRLGRASRAND